MSTEELTLPADLTPAISFELPPVPRLSSRPALALVAELLPTIQDDLTADLIEHLAETLCDCQEDLEAERELRTSAIAMLGDRHVEIRRLRERLASLLRDRRGATRQS